MGAMMNTKPRPHPVVLAPADAKRLGRALLAAQKAQDAARRERPARDPKHAELLEAMRPWLRAIEPPAAKALANAPAAQVLETALLALPATERALARFALNLHAPTRQSAIELCRQAQQLLKPQAPSPRP
jgi:hypothetical protein